MNNDESRRHIGGESIAQPVINSGRPLNANEEKILHFLRTWVEKEDARISREIAPLQRGIQTIRLLRKITRDNQAIAELRVHLENDMHAWQSAEMSGTYGEAYSRLFKEGILQDYPSSSKEYKIPESEVTMEEDNGQWEVTAIIDITYDENTSSYTVFSTVFNFMFNIEDIELLEKKLLQEINDILKSHRNNRLHIKREIKLASLEKRKSNTSPPN